MGLRLGHEAVMMQDAQAVLADARELQRQHHAKNGLMSSKPEEMGDIHIGDKHEYRSPGMSGIAKAVIGAGLLASGVGVGALVADRFLGDGKIVEKLIPGETKTELREKTVEVEVIPPKG